MNHDYIILISYLILVVMAGVLAKNKKIGVVPAVIISILLTPIIGLLVVVFSGKKTPKVEFEPDLTPDFSESSFEDEFDEDTIEAMIEEIDDIEDNPQAVREWLSNAKKFHGWVPNKVYARAMAAIEGRVWLTDDEFFEDE